MCLGEGGRVCDKDKEAKGGRCVKGVGALINEGRWNG